MIIHTWWSTRISSLLNTPIGSQILKLHLEGEGCSKISWILGWKMSKEGRWVEREAWRRDRACLVVNVSSPPPPDASERPIYILRVGAARRRAETSWKWGRKMSKKLILVARKMKERGYTPLVDGLPRVSSLAKYSKRVKTTDLSWGGAARRRAEISKNGAGKCLDYG